MRRLALPVLFVLGFLAAGGLSATVVAATGTLTGTTGTDTTTTTTDTTTTGTTSTGPSPTTIPPGVTIGGVAVGGLTASGATDAVRSATAQPVVVRVGRHTLRAGPGRLGAVPQIRAAVKHALAASPNEAVRLGVDVRPRLTRAYVALLAHRYDRKPVDSVLSLRRNKPWITKDRPGQTLDRVRSVRILLATLKADRKGPVKLRLKAIPSSVTRNDFGPVIVIRRGSNHLYLYHGMRPWRDFPVATGQSSYPTPLGHYSIEVMWRNPWWYPPNSPWAAGAKPIPPGPGNPLGTRWMGLTAPGVGIHGTPDPASIGYSASHGCIRMYISNAEWLFVHVRVGTQVFIVAA
ncbi:MAG TPA: L,D-transpeptidase family protein [Gaiellaceae bacterium]